MNFFLIDDDEAIRCMLSDIIEDYDLGKVAGTAQHGGDITADLLNLKHIDVLLIDLLMPIRDGIQTIKAIKEEFTGKIIMLSQVENKEMVGRAYELGVDHYITKPINRNEVISVIKTAMDHIQLKQILHNIESNLSNALRPRHASPVPPPNKLTKDKISSTGEILLSDMGIAAEKGTKDLIKILNCLKNHENEHPDSHDMPSLKSIFYRLASQKLKDADETMLQKECKAIEQRLRRTIFQALINLASIGIIDYANPKFEDYAAKFFDFAEVRKIMLLLESEEKPNMSQAHINIKKFINMLYIEAKK